MLVVMLALFTMANGVPASEPDEDVGAHLFQIWLILEVFLIPLFAVKWMPVYSKQATVILVLQIFLVLLVYFPVFYFHL
jgi:hypothetical protein